MFSSFSEAPFSYGTNLPSNTVGLGTGTLLSVDASDCRLLHLEAALDRSLTGDALPWLMLAMVTVTSALLIMIGRAGFGPGPGQSITLRAVRGHVANCAGSLGPARSHALVWFGFDASAIRGEGLLRASPAVLIFCTCSGFVAGLPFWPMNRQQRGYGKTLVSLINVVPETDLLAKAVQIPPE